MAWEHNLTGWRKKLYIIIFESDTYAGKMFDLGLIVAILLSTITVMLESVATIRAYHSTIIHVAEWFFTILFTIEYILRIICVGRPIKYIASFYGIIDLSAILPTYLSILFPGTQYLLMIRTLRILRVFRVLKLAIYLREGEVLLKALKASRHKIIVFIATVLTLVFVLGSLMYLIEGEKNGFTSIPRSVYWAIVTLTTVGYGDIAPQTNLGQFLAAWVMILGYAIIAVPTGIVTVELTQQVKKKTPELVCPNCELNSHDADSIFCRRCGTRLK